MLDLIKVALTGANTKARKHHDSSGDVKAANLDCRGQLSNDRLDLIKVALTGANAKARKHHDSSGDVKAANLDCRA